MSFPEIYSQWYQKFVTIARRYVREQSVAEDLVTDAFVSFWEKRSEFSENDNIPAWIFTVVR